MENSKAKFSGWENSEAKFSGWENSGRNFPAGKLIFSNHEIPAITDGDSWFHPIARMLIGLPLLYFNYTAGDNLQCSFWAMPKRLACTSSDFLLHHLSLDDTNIAIVTSTTKYYPRFISYHWIGFCYSNYIFFTQSCQKPQHNFSLTLLFDPFPRSSFYHWMSSL